MKHRRGVARVVPRAIERRHVVDQVERRRRLSHHEVGFVAVDQQHVSMQFGRASGPGTGDAGEPGAAFCTPELNTPIVLTRGSAPSAIETKPPQDWPITATLSRAILPFSGEPVRVFSFPALSIAARRSSAVACRRGQPSPGTVPNTRKPCEAIVVGKPE
jgi:hypothetical protein